MTHKFKVGDRVKLKDYQRKMTVDSVTTTTVTGVYVTPNGLVHKVELNHLILDHVMNEKIDTEEFEKG